MAIQLQQERLQNDQLQGEIQRLRQQFGISIRDKERVYQAREQVRMFDTRLYKDNHVIVMDIHDSNNNSYINQKDSRILRDI